ncbi:hypothetical protein [Paenibacillus sp. W2I17]|uniref:hypothetical protein n=1 Tax=Paenibacillus sp. W2I17 TaxID=3042311 RepID=UPI0027872B48|nr:hypothetical protein [Paenibacillus sp. W2I17]MDQ0659217.1 hypothetical protein [Paenibacillus sp. W2I17]
MAAFDGLIAGNYITWKNKSDTANIFILVGWERESELPKLPQTKDTHKDNYGILD